MTKRCTQLVRSLRCEKFIIFNCLEIIATLWFFSPILQKHHTALLNFYAVHMPILVQQSYVFNILIPQTSDAYAGPVSSVTSLWSVLTLYPNINHICNVISKFDNYHLLTPRNRVHELDLSLGGCCNREDVIKWKHFPRYWPFVRGIHRWPVNSLHKGQWQLSCQIVLKICTGHDRNFK